MLLLRDAGGGGSLAISLLGPSAGLSVGPWLGSLSSPAHWGCLSCQLTSEGLIWAVNEPPFQDLGLFAHVHGFAVHHSKWAEMSPDGDT